MKKNRNATQSMQDDFLYLCITDTQFLRICKECISPVLFSEATGKLVGLCYTFYDVSGFAPSSIEKGDHFYRIFVDWLEKNVETEMCEAYFTYLKKVHDERENNPPNKEYTLTLISSYLRNKGLQDVLIEASHLVDKGDNEGAEECLNKILRKKFKFVDEDIVEEVPLEFEQEPQYVRARDTEIVCPTGLDPIDQRIGGIPVGLTCVFGGYKAGKTWFLLNLAYQAYRVGKKVLYISHEISAEEAQRRWFMFWGTAVKEIEGREVEIPTYDFNTLHRIEGQRIYCKSIYDKDLIKEVRRKSSRFNGKLLIKKYPMETCTVGEIERLLAYLEAKQGFVPDLLISDYVEKMKLPRGRDTIERDAINDVYLSLKRIADELGIAVVTASQIKIQYIDDPSPPTKGLPTEDSRKLGNVDLGLSLALHPNIDAIWYVYVPVNRNGPQKFGCMSNRCLECGLVTGTMQTLVTYQSQRKGNENE